MEIEGITRLDNYGNGFVEVEMHKEQLGKYCEPEDEPPLPPEMEEKIIQEFEPVKGKTESIKPAAPAKLGNLGGFKIKLKTQDGQMQGKTGANKDGFFTQNDL